MSARHRWARVSSILAEALDRPEADRTAFMAEAVRQEPELRTELLALFDELHDSGEFLERPAVASPADGGGWAAILAALDERVPASVRPPRLEAATTLGPYRIEALIGSGGMGEVYRARDARLGRDVALKVLLATADQGRKQRIVTEARALAALSHPYICPVFDVGEQDGIEYLVMELLSGETLARRLAKGALARDEAVRCAVEVADALDAAHRGGVVHRDLKPGNIMLTRTGAKLLDFGLAKRRHAVLGSILAAGLTGRGTLVGTLEYMAPEQLNGEDVDARTDIFAFGAVLHEMLTGRKAFAGKTPASVIAAILEHEPVAVSALQPASPSALDHVVRACLAKDPEQRWRSAGDVALQLRWLLVEGRVSGTAVTSVARRRWRRAVPLGLAAPALVAAAASWHLRSPSPPDPGRVVRFDLAIPGGELGDAGRRVMDFSADGRTLVYNTSRGLYLRRLQEAAARPVAGADEDLSAPFLSPDGQWVGYFVSGQLKKLASGGGTPVRLCNAEKPFGVRWGADGTVVYGQPAGIMRVSAAGGAPALLVPAAAGERLDGPQVLPGGDWILMTVARGTSHRRWDEADVVAQSLRSGERKVLWKGGSAARYVATGHLLYALRDAVFAVRFDVDELEVSGRPVRLVSDVHRALVPWLHAGYASYVVSDGGTLAYVRSEQVGADRALAFMDREGGIVRRLDLPPGPYVNPRLSPDGSRLAVQTVDEDGRGQVWIYDMSGRRQIRQLTMAGSNHHPIWTPDGTRVAYVSDRDGGEAIYWQPADGGAAEPLTTAGDGTYQRPDSWSPHGPTLALRRQAPGRSDTEICMLVPGSSAGVQVFSDVVGSDQYEAEFSPDGNWLAYTSTETGSDEIFVQPFPATGAKFRVTQRGGGFPIWSPHGRALFYRRSFYKDVHLSRGARLFTVDVATGNGVEFGPERTLPLEGFLVFYTYRDYDVTPDGRHFLVIVPGHKPPEPPRIVVVRHWFEELRERAPAD